MDYENWIKLSECATFESKKINSTNIKIDQYVSTENLMPYRGGLIIASSMPKGRINEYRKRDILISNIRPYFKKIWYAKHNGGCSADVLTVRSMDNIDSKYLYYVLSDDYFFDYVMKGSKGTKMPRGDKNHIMQYRLKIPPLQEQKAIASILSSLDDKIELNNKINKNLEEMAQALYKQWFVDFEFPNEDGEPYKSSGGEMIESELGLIPKGWEVGCIGDYASVKSGYAFKSSHWSESGVGVVKIKDLNDITVDLDGLSHVEKHNSEKAHNFRVYKGDILIAMTGATIGKIGIVPKFKNELYVNQRVGKFFLGDDPIKKLPFIHCLLRDFRILGSIVSAGEGSAQPNISPNGIMNIMIPYKKKVINLFNKTLFDMFDKYLNNINENRVLRNTRDTLLPKLMSGELKVPIEG